MNKINVKKDEITLELYLKPIYNPTMKLKRYELKTDRGIKITWAVSSKKAEVKATAKGFKVYDVKVKEIVIDQ